MLLDRICKECDRSFEGGPRAYYCPDCRIERKLQNKRKREECRKKKYDIIDQTFERWTVLKELDIRNGERFYLCRCKCGTEREVRRNSLVTGNSKSCGCLRKERMKETQSQLPKVNGIDIKNFTNKTRKGTKTGHKGVAPFGNGKFKAYIGFNGNNMYLGTFDTLDEAFQARKEAEEKYYTPLLKKAEEEGIFLKKFCEECGKKFLPKSRSQKFCNDTCRYRYHARKKRSDREKEGLCPQCGKEWIEPLETHLGKPKHCRRCQEYYAIRHKN